MRRSTWSAAWVALSGLLLWPACAIGPKYVKPATPNPAAAYKELNAAEGSDWRQAHPSDGTLKGAWWELFGDARLNDLELQVGVSNQNVAAAAANYLSARALVREARSQLYPTVTATPSIASVRSPLLTPGAPASAPTTGEYVLPFDVSWQADLWGKVRNTVKANVYGAQASAADLENVRLTMQAELAADYYQLRAQDALIRLFEATVADYQDSLHIAQIQFEAGLTSDETVAQAETVLHTAEAQVTNLGILRAGYEHAIALLVGQSATSFAVAADVAEFAPPPIPVGVPSQLVERRPDIAAAERRMAQANAQIGIATAAFFPNVLLNGSVGLEATTIAGWLTWPARFWSVGPALAATLFDGGLRRATVQQYEAAFDGAIASYRGSVLAAFEQVEDSLSALRILSAERQQQDAAVASAARNVRLATTRYTAGVDPYLNVIVAQTALLANQQTAIALRLNQMTASVQLIEALGGGWDASQMPTPVQIGDPAPSRLSPK
jgi:NodT family efflux transporter outer membrane factor (OMF) lipoprotein